VTADAIATVRWRRIGGWLAVAVAIAILASVWLWLNVQGIFFRDALAYWRPDLDDLYGGSRVGVQSTYLYSPAFAQLMAPFGLLPWPVFAAMWSGATILVLAWLAGPVIAALLLVIPLSPVIDEVSTGNIHIFLAAATVIGFRYSAAWAFHLLTKVTPGAGVLWFAGRRDWRRLSIALGATAVIVAVSFVLAPSSWFEWLDTLARSSEVPVPEGIAAIPGPLWLRTLVAAALAVAGGIVGWRWLVPAAVTLALPVPWSSGLSVLVAVIALWRWDELVERPVSSPDNPA
jgi:Glycosyltransferase family 87